MSSNRNRFAGVERGKPLRGSKAIANHIWRDKKKWRSAFRLPRDEYGLSVVVGELLGYEGWIDHALAVGIERRPRKRSITAPAEA
ncbi:MAG: hypothetical protein WCF81_21485 [Roseiarcus sp.]